mmetsp:Transcript_14828/g.31853  ORF Transcript_14828/g.31853 Transcript_14828/m.31853 type:complete len:353 (+) Transcript_14828:442-1500(+)
MAVGAQHGAEGRAEHHHRHAHRQELPRLLLDTAHEELTPGEPNHGVHRHQAHRRGRGHLLGDAEQQRQCGEAANVDAGARDRREHTANEASHEQRDRAPVVLAGEVLDGEVHVTPEVAVQPEQGERKCEPNRHKANLLLCRRHPGGNLLQPEDHAHKTTQTAVRKGPLLNHDPHVEDREHGSGHAAALNHEGEVASYSWLDGEGQRHHRERDGRTALGGRPGNHRTEHHGDGHVVLLLEQMEQVVLDHVRPPHKMEEDGRHQDALEPAVRVSGVLLAPLPDQLALHEVLLDEAPGGARSLDRGSLRAIFRHGCEMLAAIQGVNLLRLSDVWQSKDCTKATRFWFRNPTGKQV